MVVLPAILASCGGGAGGGGSGLNDNPAASFLPSVVEPTTPFAVTDWSASQEYQNSTGLAQLKAAEGYARRSGGLPGGEGVRIAIIDSGIDLFHPDLGNLTAQSWSAGNEPLVGDPHATFVAGIAAASRTQTGDPNDMHGLAYRASLVNFQTSRPSMKASTGNVSFSTADLVAAINMAAGLSSGSASVESDILNLSLGAFSTSDDTFSSLRSAMRAAAAADKIMVIAAGNEGLDSDATRKLQPIYPAAYADDNGIAGHAIVVGNITSGNAVAASSNFCGDTKAYCLFAPGTTIRSTLNGGGYGIGSGTSFAAPYVSGAAAVVKAAFPGVSNADVVSRLLLTANDLGDPGVDEVFGRGLLDVEAAMAPIGLVGIPTDAGVAGDQVPIASSFLDLGSAWSIGDDGQELVDRAVGFDRMGFPFPAVLTGRIRTSTWQDGLRHFIGPERQSTAGQAFGHGRLRVSMAGVSGQDRSDLFGLPSGSEHKPAPKARLTFTTGAGRDVEVFATIRGSSGTRLGIGAALDAWQLDLLQHDLSIAPFDRLSGEMSGGGLALSLSDRSTLALSAFTNSGMDRTSSKAVQKLEMAKTLFENIELRLGLGMIQEKGGFLGTNAEGVFGPSMDSRSRFADLAVMASLSRHVAWFLSYSRGRSSISVDDHSLLSDWSPADASAFAGGFSISDLARRDDRLSFVVGQPFRGDHAEATLSVPVGRTIDGTVEVERKRIDLEPSSREITSELAYRWSFGRGRAQELSTAGFLAFRPQHQSDHRPTVGLGLRYRWRF